MCHIFILVSQLTIKLVKIFPASRKYAVHIVVFVNTIVNELLCGCSYDASSFVENFEHAQNFYRTSAAADASRRLAANIYRIYNGQKQMVDAFGESAKSGCAFHSSSRCADM